MKRKLSWCLLAGYPYFVVLMYYGLLAADNEGSLMLFLLSAACLGFISLKFSHTLFRTIMREQWDAHRLAKINMAIKLSQIPAYLFIFLVDFGLAFVVPFFGFFITLMLFVFAVMAIHMTACIGKAAVLRSDQDPMQSVKIERIFLWLQGVFCLDILAAVVVFMETKKK